MRLDIDINNLNANDLQNQLPLLAAGLKSNSVGLYHGHIVSKEGNSSLASPTYRQLDIIVRKAEELSSDKLKDSLKTVRDYADRSRTISKDKGKVEQFFESLATVLGNIFK